VHTKVIMQTPSNTSETVRFHKLKNLPNDQFHNVFGDCFISGFLEGGEFTALVSLRFFDGVGSKEDRAL
jgi:hypothetical protein